MVRLVEKKCAKLRFELVVHFVIDQQKPISLLTNTNLPIREELEERMSGLEEEKRRGVGGEDWKEVRQAPNLLLGYSYKIYLDNIKQVVFAPKMREQLESERRRGEAELRGEIRKEMDKLREEVAEVQVIVENNDGDHTGESRKGG